MTGDPNFDEDGNPVWNEEYLRKHPELIIAHTYDGEDEDAYDASDAPFLELQAANARDRKDG